MSLISKLRATLSLALLTLALAQGAAARQADARPLYRLWLPGEKWALDLDLTAFNLPGYGDLPADSKKSPRPSYTDNTETFSKDLRELTLWAFLKPDGKSHTPFVNLRVKFAPALAPGTAFDFRDFVVKNLPKKLGDGVRLKGGTPKTSEYKDIPLARYSFGYEMKVPTYSWGVNTVRTAGPRTLEAYLVRDNYWITISLSAKDLGEGEEGLLHTLLDSLKFADASAPSTSFDYYHKGRVHYLTGDYANAVDSLARALTLEHKQRRLDQASWRGLVGALIDSLGESGDMERTKEAMEYAVAQDPTYPRFQLALARYYASAGDLDKTIAHLEKAYRKDAAGAPPPLPDPMYDRAFERFKDDERFRKAVKALKK